MATKPKDLDSIIRNYKPSQQNVQTSQQSGGAEKTASRSLTPDEIIRGYGLSPQTTQAASTSAKIDPYEMWRRNLEIYNRGSTVDVRQRMYDSTKSDVGLAGWWKRFNQANEERNKWNQEHILDSGYALDEFSYASLYGEQPELPSLKEAFQLAKEEKKGYKEANLNAYKNLQQAEAEYSQSLGPEMYARALAEYGGSQTLLFKDLDKAIDAAVKSGDSERENELRYIRDVYQGQVDLEKQYNERQGWVNEWKKDHKGNFKSVEDAQAIYGAADEAYQKGMSGRAIDYEKDPEYQEYMAEATDWANENLNNREWTQEEYDTYLAEQQKIAKQQADMRFLTGGSERVYVSDEELSQLAKEREKAQYLLDYATQHQYDYIQSALAYGQFSDEDMPDNFVLKADEGKQLFDEYKAGTFASEEDQKAYDEYMEQAEKDAIAAGYEGENLTKYLQIESDEYKARYNVQSVNSSRWDPRYHTEFMEPDDRWSDMEKQTYYYLFAVDREKANEYGANINEKHNAADAAERDIATQEFATRNLHDLKIPGTDKSIPLLGLTGSAATVGAVGANIIGGIPDYLKMLAEYGYRGDLYETKYEGLSRWGDTSIQAIASDLNERWGELPVDIPLVGGKGWGDVYQLFTSMLESGASIAVGGEVGSLASFFGMAAASSTRQALERGLDPDKALLTGFINGVAEVAGEKFSVESLLSNKGLQDFLTKGVFKTMLKQGGVEMSEEVFTTLLTTMGDLAANGDKAEIRAKIDNYMLQPGMTRDQAKKLALKDWINEIGQDALGGLLSGSLMAGGQYMGYAIPAAITDYGTGTPGSIDPQSYFDAAGLVSPETAFVKAAQKYEKRWQNKGKISNYGMGKLMATFGQAVEETGYEGSPAARDRVQAWLDGLQSEKSKESPQKQEAASGVEKPGVTKPLTNEQQDSKTGGSAVSLEQEEDGKTPEEVEAILNAELAKMNEEEASQSEPNIYNLINGLGPEAFYKMSTDARDLYDQLSTQAREFIDSMLPEGLTSEQRAEYAKELLGIVQKNLSGNRQTNANQEVSDTGTGTPLAEEQQQETEPVTEENYGEKLAEAEEKTKQKQEPVVEKPGVEKKVEGAGADSGTGGSPVDLKPKPQKGEAAVEKPGVTKPSTMTGERTDEKTGGSAVDLSPAEKIRNAEDYVRRMTGENRSEEQAPEGRKEAPKNQERESAVEKPGVTKESTAGNERTDSGTGGSAVTFAQNLDKADAILDYAQGNSKNSPIEGMTQEQAQQAVINLAEQFGFQTNQTGLRSGTKFDNAVQRARTVLQALRNIENRRSERQAQAKKNEQYSNITKAAANTVETEDGKGKITNAHYNSETGVMELTVQDENGQQRTIPRSELKGEAAELFEVLEDNLGKFAADAFNNMNEGQNVGFYASDFRTVMEYGRLSKNGNVGAILNDSRIRGVLTNGQVQTAYRIGQGMTRYEGGTPTRSLRGTGRVTMDGGIVDGHRLAAVKDQEALRNSQDFKEVQAIAKALEIDVVFFESQTDGDRYVGMQGAYQNGVIYLDVNAGKNRVGVGQRMFATTLSHELTHFIAQNAPKQYQALQDRVTQYLMLETGESFGSLVRQKMARSGSQLKYDAAVEEVVADACETMLFNSQAVQDMAQQDKGLFDAVKGFIDRFCNRILARHAEAKAIQPIIKEVQKLWDDGLKYAVENRLTGNNEKKATDKLGKDADTYYSDRGELLAARSEDGSTVLYSERTYLNGGREKLADILQQNGHTQEEIDKTLSELDKQMDFLHQLGDDYAVNMGYEALANHLQADITTYIKSGDRATQALSTLVKNGEYPVNFDLALICKKRVAYMRMMTKLIEDGIFDKVKFQGAAIADVNTILRNNGFETACLGCFVEARRLQLQKWAETIVKEWNEAVDQRNPNAGYFGFSEGLKEFSLNEIEDFVDELEKAGEKNDKDNVKLKSGAVAKKMGELQDRVPSLQQKLTIADLLTPKGMSMLRSYDQNLFSLVKQRYGSNSPKIVQEFNPYNSEVADLGFEYLKEMTGDAVKGAREFLKQAKEQNPQKPGESNEDYEARVETIALRNYLYKIGGARIQSFSDFMIENLFDYLQILNDLAARELPMHGYTKEASFVRLFGMTGIKINGSWIAHTERSMGKEYAGLLPVEEASNGRGIVVTVDGKQYAICMDDYARNQATGSFIQSIGMKDMVALQLDPRYSAHVGSITIGVSDKQILAMLDSDYFRMIIPYHASGMLKIFAELVGVDSYNDYTNYQNTKVKSIRMTGYGTVTIKTNPRTGKQKLFNSKGKELSVDTSFAYNEAVQRLGDARAAADEYLRWCADDKQHPIYDGDTIVGYATFSPKFSDSKYHTDFTTHPNYYKLLEDFNSYDMDGVSALQGAAQVKLPSVENRMTAEQMEAYKQALRDTGLFTEKEVEKYAKKADMTFEELVKEEVQGRAVYESEQAKVWDKTVEEVEKTLLENHPRNKPAAKKKASQKSAAKKSDRDYMAAVEDNDIDTAQMLVNQAAFAAGAIRNKSGRGPLHLYHGSPAFGFTEFRPDRLIYLTNNPSVSAGYTDGKAYGRKRRISEYYTEDDGTDATLIKNAKNVLDQTWKPVTHHVTDEIFRDIKKTAVELNDKVNEVYSSEALDVLNELMAGMDEDERNKLSNQLNWMIYLPGAVAENIDDFRSGDYYWWGGAEEAVRSFSSDIEHIEESEDPVKDFLSENREKIKGTAAWDLYQFLRGFDMGDFVIDVKYKMLLAMQPEGKLASESGSLVSKDRIREAVEQAKDVGSYDLFGFAGEKPLEIDAKGAFWTSIAAPMFGDKLYSTDEIGKMAKEQGYTSVEIRNVMDPAGTNHTTNVLADDYIFFSSDQVKSADPVTYDDNGNVIPLSERFDTSKGDIRYSERDNARTDRELLMDSEAVLTSSEKKALAEYQAKVRDFEERERKVQAALDALDQMVRAGSPDVQKQRSKVSNLQAGMNKALRELTQAETKDKTLLEIIRKEREIQRKRTAYATRETFTKRELRGRITKLYNDLNRRITSPSEKKNIPVNVMMQAIEVLEAINMDSSREGSKAGEKLRNKLLDLKQKYEALQNDPDFRNAATYDPVVAELLGNMVEKVGDTPINKMNAGQMMTVYEALTALDKVARTALKVKMLGEERDAYNVAKQMGEETQSVKKPHKNLFAQWINAQLSPERMFNRMGGYQMNSAWNDVYRMLDDGQLRQMQIQMEGTMLFDELLKGKEYDKFISPKNTVDIGLKDKDGKAIPITRGMMVALYMHLQNEQNVRHIMYGGLTVPNLKDYYNRRNSSGMDSAVRAVGVSQELADLRDELHNAETDAQKDVIRNEMKMVEARGEAYIAGLQESIEKQLTGYDRKWIAAAKELFDVYSKQWINETTMDVYGIKRANVENYFPIWVDGDFLNTPFESIAKDMNLENAGFVKERVDSSKPIRLADLSDVASTQIRRVSQYCGLMPVTRNFQKIWGKVQTGYRGSLQADVRDKFGTAGIQYIENLMADLNGARRGQDGPLGELLNTLRGHMARASLTLSLRTALGQAASYPTAASVIGWEPLTKALGQPKTHAGRVKRAELIQKYSPMMWYRMKGYSTTELGDIAGSNSKFDRVWKKAHIITGWIQGMDVLTVGKLWDAAEIYVADRNKALQRGSDAYYQEVAKTFNEIIEKSQPNYTTMQRPDILRNPNALVRQLTMFLTQRLQNFNILYDSMATYSQARKDLKSGKVTAQQVSEAGRNVRRAVVSQLVAAATIVGFKFVADIILHSLNAYRDDDKELTKESISTELLDMFLDSLAGNMLFGSEIYDLVESKVFGKTYYGIEISAISTVTDMIDSVSKFAEAAAKEDASWDKLKPKADKLIKNVATVFGIPYGNAEKIVKGIIYHTQDIVNGEVWHFEAGVERTTAQQAHRLYRAYTEGNYGTANKIREQVGDDEKLNDAMKEYIKKQYKDGAITKTQAQTQLVKYANVRQADAEKAMREYSCLVETGIAYSKIGESFVDGKITAAQAKKMLVKYGEKSSQDAEKMIEQYKCEKATGVKYSQIDDDLRDGRISETRAAQMWQQYGGMDKTKAEAKASFIVYQNKNPNTTLETASYLTWYTKYRSILTASQYESYDTKMKACKGKDKDGDGKADAGTVKKQKLKIIDSLPISSKEKDELYLINGWSKNTIKDAPWRKKK